MADRAAVEPGGARGAFGCGGVVEPACGAGAGRGHACSSAGFVLAGVPRVAVPAAEGWRCGRGGAQSVQGNRHGSIGVCGPCWIGGARNHHHDDRGDGPLPVGVSPSGWWSPWPRLCGWRVAVGWGCVSGAPPVRRPLPLLLMPPPPCSMGCPLFGGAPPVPRGWGVRVTAPSCWWPSPCCVARPVV